MYVQIFDRILSLKRTLKFLGDRMYITVCPKFTEWFSIYIGGIFRKYRFLFQLSAFKY